MTKIVRQDWKVHDRIVDILHQVARGEPLTDEDRALLRDRYDLLDADNRWGQFWTPPHVSASIVRLLSLQAGQRVLVPGCGWGSFVEPLLGIGAEVVGVEAVVQTYHAALGLWGHHENIAIINSDVYRGYWGDGSDGSSCRPSLGEPFDAVVGNPPWGLTLDLDGGSLAPGRPPSQLMNKAHKTPSEAAFAEIALRVLRPGGWLAFIFPSRVYGNANGKPWGTGTKLRPLLDERWVEWIVRLPDTTFAPAVTTQSDIWIVRNVEGPGPRQVVSIEHVGQDRKGQPTDRDDLAEWVAGQSAVHWLPAPAEDEPDANLMPSPPPETQDEGEPAGDPPLDDPQALCQSITADLERAKDLMERIAEDLARGPGEAATEPTSGEEPPPPLAEEEPPAVKRPYRRWTKRRIKAEIRRLKRQAKQLAGASDFAYDLAINDGGARLKQVQAQQEAVWDKLDALHWELAYREQPAPAPRPDGEPGSPPAESSPADRPPSPVVATAAGASANSGEVPSATPTPGGDVTDQTATPTSTVLPVVCGSCTRMARRRKGDETGLCAYHWGREVQANDPACDCQGFRRQGLITK